MKKNRPLQDKDNIRKTSSDFSRYSTMAIKMGGVITAGFLGGNYLDKYMALKVPVFTLVLGMLGLALSMYIIFVDTRKK